MLTEEQIRSASEVLTAGSDEDSYLLNRVPLNKDHEEWLQRRGRGLSANQTASETSVSTSLADQPASTNSR